MRIGYFSSSEEFGPRELVEQARMAEQAGFEGFDELYIQQIGPEQEPFFELYAREILPRFTARAAA